MDQKTWGWIKVLGGLIALYFSGKIWMAAKGDTIALSVAILALLTVVGGYWKATGKK